MPSWHDMPTVRTLPTGVHDPESEPQMDPYWSSRPMYPPGKMYPKSKVPHRAALAAIPDRQTNEETKVSERVRASYRTVNTPVGPISVPTFSDAKDRRRELPLTTYILDQVSESLAGESRLPPFKARNF